MRTEWLDKHIEPSRLCDPVRGFFERRGLKTRETLSEGKHRIEVFPVDAVSMLFVVVEICGDSNRIAVDFLPWGKHERTAQQMLTSSVTAILGGGVLVRQDLKKKELMEQVENQFWDFLDNHVLELSS